MQFTKQFFFDALRSARAVILITVSILLLAIAMSLILKAQSPEINPELMVVENEHRLSVVETKLDLIQQNIASIQQYNWLVYTGLAGLAGEAGLRIIKKPKSE